jgi:hypothetical protein
MDSEGGVTRRRGERGGVRWDDACPLSASPRLYGSFCLMDVGAFRDGFEWHHLLRKSAGGDSPAETPRRRDMGHQPLRLRASAGVFASWAWVHSATDSNGIARCVTSAGGDSPAVTQRRGDMGQLTQMNEWVDHRGEGPSCRPAPREGTRPTKRTSASIGVHLRLRNFRWALGSG